ncbi:MAG: hypothetical protein VKL41_22735 [Snowella sp.]|nr:hypothetical protein [Snowella sp.]
MLLITTSVLLVLTTFFIYKVSQGILNGISLTITQWLQSNTKKPSSFFKKVSILILGLATLIGIWIGLFQFSTANIHLNFFPFPKLGF